MGGEVKRKLTNGVGTCCIQHYYRWCAAASSRLNWGPHADLNGLVRFAERRNLVSARVPSHFKPSLNTLRERDTYTSTKPKFHWLETVANMRTYSSTTYSYFIRDFTASLKQILILCSTFSNVIFVWLIVIHNTAVLTKNHKNEIWKPSVDFVFRSLITLMSINTLKCYKINVKYTKI